MAEGDGGTRNSDAQEGVIGAHSKGLIAGLYLDASVKG